MSYMVRILIGVMKFPLREAVFRPFVCDTQIYFTPSLSVLYYCRLGIIISINYGLGNLVFQP